MTMLRKSSSRSRECGADTPVCAAPTGVSVPQSRWVNPNSRSNSSSRARSSVTRQMLHDEIEDAVRDCDLGGLCDFRCLAVARNHEHLVLIGVESDRRIGHVVRDNQICFLALELFAGVFL